MVTVTPGSSSGGVIELPPYEDDIEMTEEQEEELLRDAPSNLEGSRMEMGLAAANNPFMGAPATPQQQEFLKALQEALQ
jgi:hypothetical protein